MKTRTIEQVREYAVKAVSQYTTEVSESAEKVVTELRHVFGESILSMSGEELGENILGICDDLFYEVRIEHEKADGSIEVIGSFDENGDCI